MKAQLLRCMKQVDRGADGLPDRLRLPDPNDVSVVAAEVDPKIRFGQPRIPATGIPTAIIYERWRAGEPAAQLAGAVYERPVTEVTSAIGYEESSRAARPLPPSTWTRRNGPRLVGLLREMNLHAVTYRDVRAIESGDRDVDSIPNVAARRWIAVTGDKRLRRRLVDLQAIQNARLRLVVVATRMSTEDEAAHVIDKHGKSVLALAHHMPGPYVISLTRQHLEHLRTPRFHLAWRGTSVISSSLVVQRHASSLERPLGEHGAHGHVLIA